MAFLARIIIVLFILAGKHTLSFGQGIIYQKVVPDIANLSMEEKHKIVTFFDGLSKIRNITYGNMHARFEIDKVEERDNVKIRTKTSVKFWSREHRYYRVDVKIVESDKSDRIGNTFQTIIRPDSAITLLSEKDGAPFFLVNRPPPGSSL